MLWGSGTRIRLGIAVAVLAAVAAPLGSAGSRASLRVVRAAPLSVGGSGFGARERLRVTATAGDQSWRAAVTAGARGGFVATWAEARWEACSMPLVLVARGAASGTVKRTFPVRDCAMQ
jgi:hypothetical protein